MTDVTAEMAKNTVQNTKKARDVSGITPALVTCYRQIGISAVAAAARYQGGSKNPEYAPVATRWQDYTGDAAA